MSSKTRSSLEKVAPPLSSAPGDPVVSTSVPSNSVSPRNAGPVITTLLQTASDALKALFLEMKRSGCPAVDLVKPLEDLIGEAKQSHSLTRNTIGIAQDNSESPAKQHSLAELRASSLKTQWEATKSRFLLDSFLGGRAILDSWRLLKSGPIPTDTEVAFISPRRR